jgi:alpha-amylase
VCQHRCGNIANMVDYRREAIDACQGIGDTLVDYWWAEGTNRIGFGCMDKGYVVINNGGDILNATIQTGMAPGTYCNVLSNDEPCGGDTVEVDAEGRINIIVIRKKALAIHVGARP